MNGILIKVADFNAISTDCLISGRSHASLHELSPFRNRAADNLAGFVCIVREIEPKTRRNINLASDGSGFFMRVPHGLSKNRPSAETRIFTGRRNTLCRRANAGVSVILKGALCNRRAAFELLPLGRVPCEQKTWFCETLRVGIALGGRSVPCDLVGGIHSQH